MTRLNAALRDFIEDLKIRCILARARVRARRLTAGHRAAFAAAASNGTSAGETSMSKKPTHDTREEQLHWAIRPPLTLCARPPARRSTSSS
jgi:hypothetical protein